MDQPWCIVELWVRDPLDFSGSDRLASLSGGPSHACDSYCTYRIHFCDFSGSA